MTIIAEKPSAELGAEEKMIALKILLVIYLYQKRYLEALTDIEELLNDPEMQSHVEYLLLKKDEVRMASASLSNERRPTFL